MGAKSSSLNPARGLVLLKPIETSETLGQGKIILTLTTREAMTTHQMEVVAIGAPSLCEDTDCERPHITGHLGTKWYNQFHPHHLTEGDWVLVRHRSLLETHQEGLYCAHQDDIQAILVVDAKP